jgi:hypothetical protein
MPQHIDAARQKLVAASVDVFVAAHSGWASPRVQAAAEAIEEALFALTSEMDARRDLPPDEEGVSLCQAP